MPHPQLNRNIPIPQYFSGKSIFITGGSGFLGRVLIEKLLRSCPDLKNIYMVLRPKRNRSIEERIRDLTNVPLFDELRKQNEHFLNKIIPVNGDIKEVNLGISEEDRKSLIENVNIVYHSAASVRFDDHLKDAILTNVRSAREIITLALEMKSLDVFVHVSTLYANADHMVLEEKLYPRHDWRDTIALAENCDDTIIEVMTQKFIHPLPNTYTFTKSVAELLVADLCKNKIPAVIIRPSIVVPSILEPVVGWIDNFNGPFGFNVAGAKGLLKTVYCDPDVKLDYVYVDNVVKSMIVASWKKATEKQIQDVLICNAASDAFLSVSFSFKNVDAIIDNPPETYIWPISFMYTNCFYMFFLTNLIYQIIPAIFIDGLRWAFGQKRRILKIQRRIYLANLVVLRFLQNEWKSNNENYLRLDEEILDEDREKFSTYRTNQYDDLVRQFYMSIKVYLLKEKPIATKNEVLRYNM
ncbi:putative fatty acyl-CoA reductase CG5065 isoform X2 [Leptinotarsa decemlineata]|uniref:putative fatty acyl-CoA reductase CG5065 isoform X2 n=1 Tax=Leptinotarsa decemlineata TaxID=7539 RepID=UPI003D3069D4